MAACKKRGECRDKISTRPAFEEKERTSQGFSPFALLHQSEGCSGAVLCGSCSHAGRAITSQCTCRLVVLSIIVCGVLLLLLDTAPDLLCSTTDGVTDWCIDRSGAMQIKRFYLHASILSFSPLGVTHSTIWVPYSRWPCTVHTIMRCYWILRIYGHSKSESNIKISTYSYMSVI